MKPAPAPRPNKNISGGKPQSSGKRARIVNPILNQSPKIRLKDAERLISQGRAEWVAPLQLRLVASHRANQINARAAAVGYDRAAAVLVRSTAELRHIPLIGFEKMFVNRSRTVTQK